MLTDAQKAVREDSIGSSDAPVVAGLSPYKSPLALYYEMHGDLPRYTDEETQAQRIGSKLEPVIADLAAEELSLKIRRCAPRRSTLHPFMSANLDFEIIANPKGPGVFEIKNRSGMKPWDELPQDIELQTRHQMAVTRRTWGIVAALFQFGTIRHYELERDLEIEEYLIEIEAKFLLRVREGRPPDTAWDKESIGLLKRLYPQDSGKTVTLDSPEALLAVGEYLGAKEAIKTYEDKEAAAKGWIQAAMQDASIAEIPGYTCTWKSTKAGKAFDMERFKAEHADLWEQYQTTKAGYRRFTVKPAKGII